MTSLTCEFQVVDIHVIIIHQCVHFHQMSQQYYYCIHFVFEVIMILECHERESIHENAFERVHMYK